MTLVDVEAEATQLESQEQQPMWELAECTCPDPCCERDHEQD